MTKTHLRNPFEKSLDRYKMITFWCLIIFLAFLALVQVYFRVPSIDSSVYLGDLYLLYILSVTILVLSLLGTCFMAGFTARELLLKKTTDIQLKQLDAVIQAEENPEFKNSLVEGIKNFQTKEKE